MLFRSASSISLKNAERFVIHLQSGGIIGAEIAAQGHGQVQVVCGRYDSAAEAQSAANKLRASPLAKDCWVKRLQL